MPMKVYISADIEGATGLVAWAQCGRPDGKHYDYEFARRMMTHDVNAAIRGARSGGATEIVVRDAHGSMKNLLIDSLEPGIQLISGSGGMTDGLDESFQVVFLVGYHAMAGAKYGVMAHTLTGGVHSLSLNGHSCGEIALAAAFAGEQNIPVALVTSDDQGCFEARAAIPDLEIAVTKYGMGRYQGRLLHPNETSKLIEQAAERAMSSPAAPFKLESPVQIDLAFNRSEDADACSRIPGVERTSGHACAFRSYNVKEALRTVELMIDMGATGPEANR
jgi:D-amino peptidase